jgi:hypothetical protein
LPFSQVMTPLISISTSEDCQFPQDREPLSVSTGKGTSCPFPQLWVPVHFHRFRYLPGPFPQLKASLVNFHRIGNLNPSLQVYGISCPFPQVMVFHFHFQRSGYLLSIFTGSSSSVHLYGTSVHLYRMVWVPSIHF